jgi:hypothetical protein
MFVGTVDLGNGTQLELIIIPLKGSYLRGRWDSKTDLLLLCEMGSGKFCICRPSDHPSRYNEKLGLPLSDAEHLARWLQSNLQ